MGMINIMTFMKTVQVVQIPLVMDAIMAFNLMDNVLIIVPILIMEK